MSDLISRQAAIDAIRASTSKYTVFMEMEMYTDDDAVEAIEALPSADRPQGEWIKDNLGTVICSECKRPRRDNRISHVNFCNSCGARMKGADDVLR